MCGFQTNRSTGTQPPAMCRGKSAMPAASISKKRISSGTARAMLQSNSRTRMTANWYALQATADIRPR